MEKARGKDHLRAVAKLTEEVDGKLRFRADPPLLTPIDELVDAGHEAETLDSLLGALDDYRVTLGGDRQHLLSRYQFVDLARKVVGVGSVGTRCWVALFIGRDEGDPLVLQVKEAEHSVAEPFLQPSVYANMGQRVVEGQRLVQSASDIFLGWDTGAAIDGVARDFYFRQMWDWKLSPDVETMAARDLRGLRPDVRLGAGPRSRPVGRRHRHRRPTSGAGPGSTRPCARSPRPTPTRTSSTTRP